ncbi:hypothetical protein GCM10008937_11120 [Deinococcus depolymerans]|uniref:GGDEF domain-containing protein n=2 Tax=Deinococcus depolymerans TaxID=392408 RepID=A0ABN1BT29_9DEIO
MNTAPPASLSPLDTAWAARDDQPSVARAVVRAELGGRNDAQAGVIAAYLLWRDGALPDAVERVTVSLNHLRLAAPSVWLGRGLNILAALQSQLNRPDLAVSLYEEQVDLARHIRDPELSATALHDLGVELRLSDPGRARQHITEALLAFQAMNYAHGVAVAHTNLAEFAQRAGDHHTTLHHATQALTFPHLDQQPTLEVEVQAALLHALSALNDPRADRTRARLEFFNRADSNPEVQITAALALARHATPDRVPTLLLPALDRARQLGEHVSLPVLHEALSVAYAALGDHASALTHLQETLRLERHRHTAERRQNFQSFEVLRRIQSLQDMAEQERLRNDELNVHLQELRDLNRRIRELGRTDHLTQLTNREHLFHEGERLAAASTPDRPLAAAIIDVDHFKLINDTWGHQMGDRVLQQVARLIRSVARPGDVAARYGGEEFTILRPDATAAQLAATCQELQRRLQEHPWHSIAPDLRVTLSIGVADTTSAAHPAPLPNRPDAPVAPDVPGATARLDALIAEADRRLYAVKNAGRDAIRAEP